MTQAARAQKIESYARAHEVLVAALQRFPQEMWHFKPDAATWSVHETVVHITDSEANSYIRCRRLIAEPGSEVMAYDENQWAAALDYSQQSVADALELFKWLRRKSYTLIANLPEPVWAQTVHHPENGTMRLDDWLDVYERHVPEHIAQMEAVYTAWRGQGANNHGS